ncbi:MAG TPA: SIS domain-containing protein [Steroidobacteraceae bacterium]|jgi:glucosamine--fructose-6-phosphate aminotransferase (isomerizing)|nr:SIS domain-containing protein [Steroidobacteraceae bacterium]
MNADSSPSAEKTLMFGEAADASNAVRALYRHPAEMAAVGAALRKLRPRAVITCARGSSDHAATYAKYLIETHAQVLTASAAPSVSSLYGVTQDVRGCLFIAISQSGQSPDLLASVAAAKASGATILALCNSADSPLMAAADLAVELRAGPEKSVAATKSYLASLAAVAAVVAAWTQDAVLEGALASLPDLMDRSWRLDWSAALAPLESAENLYVVGRGLGLGAAQEIALKCKETCRLHAEAFSSAELRHGPYTLLRQGFPALLFAQPDATRSGIETLALELARRGVPTLLAGADAAGATLLPTIHAAAELAPILLVQAAYRMIATLAVRRGLDPDHPPHLCKITETV